jgi:predicted metalloprotease with PDZ domain
MGCEMVWQDGAPVWLGAEFDFMGDRAVVKTVLLDSPAARSGLNAGDELISLNGLRVLKEDVEKFAQNLKIDVNYEFIVARLGKLTKLDVRFDKGPRSLKEIKIVDRAVAEKAFKR